MTRYKLLLALAVLLVPLSARAQQAQCVTARSRCQGSPGQEEGSACQCPGNPRAWGAIIVTGGAPAPAPANRSRPKLRNDDLDDGDDVLAGPRHHRPQRPAADAED